MSFCDVTTDVVMEGESSIALPRPGFCNSDNAPLEMFHVSASLASEVATSFNAAEEAAKIRELTQQRIRFRKEKTRRFKSLVRKRANDIIRHQQAEAGSSVPVHSHAELSRLIVRGSHIEIEPTADAGVSGEGYTSVLPPDAVPPPPLTQEEVELRRLAAMTPVPLDQQRIHVALETQRARAALARCAMATGSSMAPPIPPAVGPHAVPVAPHVPSQPLGQFNASNAFAPPSEGCAVAHKRDGHSRGHGHENCVPQWNAQPDNWREKNRAKAVQSIVQARKTYMERERNLVRARVARQRRRASEAQARARQQRQQQIAEAEAARLRAAATAARAAREAALRNAAEAADTAEAEEQLRSRRRVDEGRRFIEALRKRALEKIERKGITLPPLCNCTPGASLFSPQWETCANNCPFYHNPAAYTRALADLFRALDLS